MATSSAEGTPRPETSPCTRASRFLTTNASKNVTGHVSRGGTEAVDLNALNFGESRRHAPEPFSQFVVFNREESVDCPSLSASGGLKQRAMEVVSSIPKHIACGAAITPQQNDESSGSRR